jgi:hypothetical protein
MSEINTQKITKEFCANRRLCFHPKTPDEARFIQEQLFKMGFGWRAAEKRFYIAISCQKARCTWKTAPSSGMKAAAGQRTVSFVTPRNSIIAM